MAQLTEITKAFSESLPEYEREHLGKIERFAESYSWEYGFSGCYLDGEDIVLMVHDLTSDLARRFINGELFEGSPIKVIYGQIPHILPE